MSYLIHLLVYFEIFALLAIGLNVLVGFAGMLSLAHAALFAIGGYAYAISTVGYGLPFPAAAAIAITVCLVAAAVVTLAAWRFRGDQFVLATLAIHAMVYGALVNWFDAGAPLGTARNMTNGSLGISGIPRGSLFWLDFGPTPWFAMLCSVVFGLIVWAMTLIARSPWARLVKAMRDDELVLRGLAKSTRLLKLQAVCLSSTLAAVAGVLFTAYQGYIDPAAASLDEAFLVLSMVLLGGTGNVRGPLVGAAVIVCLPEAVRFIGLPDVARANLVLAIYGLALVLLMHVRPQGLAGSYRLS